MQADVFLSLGSNIGDRAGHLNAAVTEIGNIAVIIKQSGLWESKAWGERNQDDFLNLGLLVTSELTPQQFLRRTQEIEQRLGRKKRGKWQAREIDIDIIFWGKKIVRSENLVIPHPYWHERHFVLLPLAEIAPDFVPPDSRDSLAYAAAALSAESLDEIRKKSG